MRWFRRRSARPADAGPGPVAAAGVPAQSSAKGTRDATVAHLGEFARTRVGVEAYVEPPTRSTPTTVVLIAATGEWTRRRVPDARAAHRIARELGIPVYDVHRTGYPQRMRDWNSRERARLRRYEERR